MKFRFEHEFYCAERELQMSLIRPMVGLPIDGLPADDWPNER
jgi:hypothetical protein